MPAQKYLIFRLNRHKFALPIDLIERVLDDRSISAFRESTPLVMGIFELQGSSFVALDLRVRLKFEPSILPANYLVLTNAHAHVALRVDGVDGIVSFNDEEVEKSTSALNLLDDPIIAGNAKHRDHPVHLLAADYIVPQEVSLAISQLNTVAA